MARKVVIYHQPKDPAVVHRYYFEKHFPLATKLPALRKYEVSHGPITSPVGSEAHMIATWHVDDAQAMRQAFASDAGELCAADRKEFALTSGSRHGFSILARCTP